MLAWLAVRPLGSFATEYSYYAPLGALTVVRRRSRCRCSSFEVVIGILLGAGIALAVQVVPPRSRCPSAWRWSSAAWWSARPASPGAMSGWCPRGHVRDDRRAGRPVGYTAAYGGLTALGALVGVAVDLVLPSCPSPGCHRPGPPAPSSPTSSTRSPRRWSRSPRGGMARAPAHPGADCAGRRGPRRPGARRPARELEGRPLVRAGRPPRPPGAGVAEPRRLRRRGDRPGRRPARRDPSTTRWPPTQGGDRCGATVRRGLLRGSPRDRRGPPRRDRL